MFRQKHQFKGLILLGIALVFGLRGDSNPTRADSYAIKYFLDEPPSAADLSNLPSGASDVTIANVHVIGGVASLKPRHGPSPYPLTALFWAQIEIVDVLRGSALPGNQYDVYFGVPGSTQDYYMFPLARNTLYAPPTKPKEYFVVSYTEAGVGSAQPHQLLGFPATQSEYDTWLKETSEQSRPQRVK